MSESQVIDWCQDDDDDETVAAVPSAAARRNPSTLPAAAASSAASAQVIEQLDDDDDDAIRPQSTFLKRKKHDSAAIADSKPPAKPRAAVSAGGAEHAAAAAVGDVDPAQTARFQVKNDPVSPSLFRRRKRNSSDRAASAVGRAVAKPSPASAAASHGRMHSTHTSPCAARRGQRKHPPSAVAAAATTLPPKPTPPPLAPIMLSQLDQVLEVFPDVDHAHLQGLLQTHDNNVMMVLSLLADDKSYPKSKTAQAFVNNSAAVVIGATPMNVAHANHRDKRPKPSYNYWSAAAAPSSPSFTPTSDYVREAKAQLVQDFGFLTSNGVAKLLKHVGHNHYAICHEAICRAIMLVDDDTDTNNKTITASIFNVHQKQLQDEEEEKLEQYYRRFKSAKQQGAQLTEAQHRRLMVGRRRTTRVRFTKTNSPAKKATKRPIITNAILKEEVDIVQRNISEWMNAVHIRLERKQARVAAQEAGTTFECPCCCMDVAVDEMIACRNEGHLFCVDCLRRYAETQIFTLGSFGLHPVTKRPATDLVCMHVDGCTSAFDVMHLRKALPEKVMAKYDELQFQAAVNAAGVELFSCPKCNYQAELPQTQMIFQCPVAECGEETCRKCGEPAHIPLKCSEVEKKNETQGRLKVEEAISNAKIRTCPKPGCGKKFVKEGTGCNKMTCACGAFSCYVCRALITRKVSYKHFCQTPHCNHASCGECPLYSNAEEDDKRAMREAGIEAAEIVRSESLLHATDTRPSSSSGIARKQQAPSEVRVDVESLLKEVPAGNSLGMQV